MCPDAAEPGAAEAVRIVEWGHERLDDLVALSTLAFPEESLGAEDMELLCFADVVAGSDSAPARRSVVLGAEDGSVAAVVELGTRPGRVSAIDPPRTAQLQLVAVHPARRRRGLARAAVRAGESWARGQGATEMAVGGGAPFYLFSGVDTRWTEALCLFESMGYDRTSVLLDLVCPTLQSTRRPVPPGVVVHHVESDEQLEDLCRFASESFPHWSEEFRRAGESGTVVTARDSRDGRVLGAAAHSVSRIGVVGPIGVLDDGHHSGIGTALMGAVLGDLSTAGLRSAEIAWTSTVSFYAKACGAKVGRASQVHRRNLVDAVGE